jgi:adenylosuccinate lyase
MSISPLDSSLYTPLFTVSEITAVFTDQTHIQQMLHVEAALAVLEPLLGQVIGLLAGLADGHRHTVPADRRHTLLAARDDSTTPPTYRFDIHMQGVNETIFFDPQPQPG